MSAMITASLPEGPSICPGIVELPAAHVHRRGEAAGARVAERVVVALVLVHDRLTACSPTRGSAGS
jgi:hypothetical protein